MSDDQLLTIQELVDSATNSLRTARNMLAELTGVQDSSRQKFASRAAVVSSGSPTSGKVVEGVFDGQNMVDSDGQTYPVPANYASKSKLVENDGMKLTITEDGKFIYKQIRPVDRRTVVGALIQEDGQYKVLAEGRTFRVLLASVTFYRAEVGDQVTIILPKDGDATWGAVENVIPRNVSEAAARRYVQGDEDGELTPAVND
ncbi:MAG TPA: hypothetical protein VJB60_02515 [Candidatus Peribacterales bacterium]|nr:hypothetical protein [Candidatus Peribacterales bacterium]